VLRGAADGPATGGLSGAGCAAGGKARLESADVSILALGALEVGEALKAADLLAARGVSANVVDMFTLAPLDADIVREAAAGTRGIVTCENHRLSGGLGSAVAEVLAALPSHAPLACVGVEAGLFGEVGTQDWLAERFGLTAPHIAEKAMAVMNKERLG